MPCRNDYPTSTYDAVANVRAELEPILCEACTLLEDAGALKRASPELLQWYKNHSAKEEDRVAYEAAMKLSERERRLLGIDLDNLKVKAERKCSK